MSALAIAQPRDLAALAEAMTAAKGALHLIAGGTDMLIAGRDLPEDGLLIDLGRVEELSFIDAEDGAIRIGAGATFSALIRHAGLARRLPGLVQAAASSGSVQIRNRATVGGNIANAAPSADLLPVLMAAEARLAVLDRRGMRTEIALADYRPASDVAILEVRLPAAALLSHSAFAKLGPRRELTIARLSLAALADFDGGRIGVVRLVAGAIAPRPIRLPGVEATLTGQRLDARTLRAFLTALADAVDAAIPGRASRAWKRRAVMGVGLDVLSRLTGRTFGNALLAEVLR